MSANDERPEDHLNGHRSPEPGPAPALQIAVINEDDIRAIAKAASEAASQEGKVTFRPGKFSGENKDNEPTIEQWCDTIDRAAAVSGWKKEMSAAAAIECLRGEAYRWVDNLKLAEKADRNALSDWDLLKQRLLIRFKKQPSPIQLIDLITNLKQKNNESANSFYDRVENAIKRCMKEELDPLLELENGDDGRPRFNPQRQGYLIARERQIKLNFLAGLRMDIRIWIEGSVDTENATLDTWKRAAMRADDALKGKLNSTNKFALASMALTQQQAQEDNRMVAALQRSRPQGAARKATPQPRQRAAPGTGFFAAQKKLPISQREWILCRKCGQWGQHFANECTISAADMGRFSRQTYADKPTGQPRDRQSPN